MFRGLPVIKAVCLIIVWLMQAQNANRLRWFGSWWIIIDSIIQVNVREGHRAIGNRQSSRPLLRADRQVDIRLPHQHWMRQRLSSGRTLGFTGRGQDHFGILVTAQSESEITKKKSVQTIAALAKVVWLNDDKVRDLAVLGKALRVRSTGTPLLGTRGAFVAGGKAFYKVKAPSKKAGGKTLIFIPFKKIL